MKKVRLLCLLALLFAVGSAFTTTKDGVRIYAVSDGQNGYFWTTTPPSEECTLPIPVPCFYDLEKTAPIPDDNTLPPDEDILDQSEEDGVHPA